MSRTDKDVPAWVRALRNPAARVHHSWLCEHTSYGLMRPSMSRACDLDDPTDPRSNRCFRWTDDRTRWYTQAGPGPDRLHGLYFGPERAAVRDSLRDAARDWNTHGDTDVEPPVRQSRNSTWYGGYWD